MHIFDSIKQLKTIIIVLTCLLCTSLQSKATTLLEYLNKTRKDEARITNVEYRNILIRECSKNDFDIYLALAQAELETKQGQKGIGRSRNSLLGIYKTYSSVEASICDYIRVVKTYYLTGYKTSKHLLRSYTNYSGRRYAGNKAYEQELSKVYNRIKNNIDVL
mgnify:FL=1